MTQEECLLSPHHFTHLGVCYPGDVAWIGISNPQNPQPVSFVTVAEPAAFPLFMLGLAIAALTTRHRRRAMRHSP